MIDYTCSKCGERMSSPALMVGESETCPVCGACVTVPASTEADSQGPPHPRPPSESPADSGATESPSNTVRQGMSTVASQSRLSPVGQALEEFKAVQKQWEQRNGTPTKFILLGLLSIVGAVLVLAYTEGNVRIVGCIGFSIVAVLCFVRAGRVSSSERERIRLLGIAVYEKYGLNLEQTCNLIADDPSVDIGTLPPFVELLWGQQGTAIIERKQKQIAETQLRQKLADERAALLSLVTPHLPGEQLHLVVPVYWDTVGTKAASMASGLLLGPILSVSSHRGGAVATSDSGFHLVEFGKISGEDIDLQSLRSASGTSSVKSFPLRSVQATLKSGADPPVLMVTAPFTVNLVFPASWEGNAAMASQIASAILAEGKQS